MTGRCKWLALIGLVGLFIGIARFQTQLAVLCLSVLLWILWVWILFTLQVRREWSHMRLKRSINGRTDATGVLWAGRTIHVELEWDAHPVSVAAGRLVRDVVPENLELVPPEAAPSDTAHASRKRIPFAKFRKLIGAFFYLPIDPYRPNQRTTQASSKKVLISYDGKACGAGNILFPGVRIEFHDPFRLFRVDRFVHHMQTYRVLPSYASASDAAPHVKRLNAIPRQGIHRQQRAGVGFELLELREYMEGDPPKSIAWKASARRDRLMTRQYESEVPIRVQMIVDGTSSTRIGGFGHRMLDQMTHTVASLAQSITSVGDAVGSYLIDDHATHRAKAISGTRGFYELLQHLADFSVNRKPPAYRPSMKLIETAFSVMGERYPELLSPQINPAQWTWLGYIAPRMERQRVQLCNALAQLNGYSPEDHMSLLLNESKFAKDVGVFLSKCGMPWIAPLVAPQDAGAFHCDSRNHRMAQALTHAINNAHDNEVFLVVTELMGFTAQPGNYSRSAQGTEEFLQAIGLAKSKHHRVALLCPSPTFLRPQSTADTLPNDLNKLRLAAEHVRLREIAAPLQRRLSKLGVPLTFTGEPRAIRLVMAEIGVARSGRMIANGRGRSS